MNYESIPCICVCGYQNYMVIFIMCFTVLFQIFCNNIYHLVNLVRVH